ncbi:GNAT family N-acetyltransferase [Uliginosibacterium sp. H3]|uniref:GNAT family N-acetyltransferase n=1 Tax=Uliginosibacterium silvisoli TaxID=3114758 RepID=A0ABU6K0Z8_9RHOO|nr:GNAT family N-acetyltransferase [Uliginosibacterium sp. H3]
MELTSFRPEHQDRLEAFLKVMQESRGYRFDPAKLPPDILSVKETYQENGLGFWVVEDAKAIVASVGLRIPHRHERIGEIKRYFVHPDFQGRGWGNRLITHAIDVAVGNRLVKLRLDTMRKSEVALLVFRKHGFHEIPKYNDNQIAEVFMEKDLTAREAQ